jgi:translation initiation factor IF-1
MFTNTFKRKSAVMAMSIMFATAPFALAGNKATSASSGQDQHYQTSQGHSATSSSSTMDMQQHQAISATVEEVNQQENRVSLRLDDGNTVEMQVPAAMVSDLQQGDSVEVSIRKADKGQQSGTSGGQHSRPQSDGMGTTPSQSLNPGSTR